ncbi:MAG: glycoside hydrolase family 31 protein, partial [Alphaproteobacteria bacterium]|nr:glycoside hydrolase family 31 protein [Alphaproteobacteria bacterium]
MTPSLELTSLSPRLHRIRVAATGAATPPSALLADRDTSLDRETAGLSITRERDAIILGDSAGTALLRLTVATGDRLGVACEVVGEQHFYGLGQGGAGFDRLGTTRRFWNVHVNHGQGGDIAIPLLLSNRGYALFFDTLKEALFDPGDCNDATLFRFTCADDALDIYLLGGGSLRATMNDVAALLGRAPMPPRWALGYLQSTRHFESPAELPAMARELRRRELPCEAIILLSSYGEALGWNRGVGHLDYAPGMRESIAELRALGFRVVLHEYPVLHEDSPLAAQARARGYLHEAAYAKSPPGPVNYEEGQQYIDFSREGAGDWWWRQHALLETDGWWLDGGEGPPATTNSPVHNGYDLLRQRIFAREDRRNFLLCRSGGPGMQRFGSACWSGDVNNDFATFEAQIAIGLNVGLSGVPYWGTDIGGYYPAAPRDPELFARWFQFGAFCGVFRGHGRRWREHLPYGHGEAVDAICRRYLALREALMPYTYSLAWQA